MAVPAEVLAKARRAADLLARLKASQGSSEFKALVDLLQLKLEQSKDALVSCAPADLSRYQGEAVAYRRLLLELNLIANQPE